MSVNQYDRLIYESIFGRLIFGWLFRICYIRFKWLRCHSRIECEPKYIYVLFQFPRFRPLSHICFFLKKNSGLFWPWIISRHNSFVLRYFSAMHSRTKPTRIHIYKRNIYNMNFTFMNLNNSQLSSSFL